MSLVMYVLLLPQGAVRRPPPRLFVPWRRQRCSPSPSRLLRLAPPTCLASVLCASLSFRASAALPLDVWWQLPLYRRSRCTAVPASIKRGSPLLFPALRVCVRP